MLASYAADELVAGKLIQPGRWDRAMHIVRQQAHVLLVSNCTPAGIPQAQRELPPKSPGLRPYWIETEPAIGPGMGVTARSVDDALLLLRQAFPDLAVVGVEAVRDMHALDQDHVVPNMGNWFRRGIWFPQGHELASS